MKRTFRQTQANTVRCLINDCRLLAYELPDGGKPSKVVKTSHDEQENNQPEVDGPTAPIIHWRDRQVPAKNESEAPDSFVKWELLPRAIQLYILGFNCAEDVIRLRPTSKLFSREALRQCNKPDYKVCMLVSHFGLTFPHLTVLKLDRGYSPFDGSPFVAVKHMELVNWYTADKICGPWQSLTTIKIKAGGDRNCMRTSFHPSCQFWAVRHLDIESVFDVTLPGTVFRGLRKWTNRGCSCFQLSNMALYDLDPDGWDEEDYAQWRVPDAAKGVVGEFSSLEQVEFINPGYGNALACHFPRLREVVVRDAAEPVLLAGWFPALERVVVSGESSPDVVLLNGRFGADGCTMPEVTVIPSEGPAEPAEQDD